MTERLDQAILEELRALMEDDFAPLLQAYLAHSAQLVQDASEACRRDDLERVRGAAHSLKGSSSNVGAVALAALCAELEHHARAGACDVLPQALGQVTTELDEVREALTALLARA